MSHARQQIRMAFAAALTGLPTTGVRVYTAHPYPLAENERPGLVVATPSDSVAPDGDLNGSKLDRILSVLIIGYADGASVENTLDTIAAEVEAAIAASGSIGAVSKRRLPTDTQIVVDGNGKQRAGEVRILFEVAYRTATGDPTTIIP